MYQKYLIVASKLDPAGINITTQLSQFKGNPVISSMRQVPAFDFYLIDKEIIYTENLDLEKINKYDFIIFASKHRSEKKEKTLSIHAPGNWRSAQLGGEPGKICQSSALFQKEIFERLNANAEKYHLKDYKITLEVTHHGPLIDKPCLFIEIGSTEVEWVYKKAGFIIAKTISEAISGFEENPYREIAIGIGGRHYCSNFNKIQLNSNIAISHIIPGYVLPLEEEMIREAIEKTQEEFDFLLIDWKGIPNSEERKRILDIFERNYIRWKKTGEIKK